jgi:cell volume regulation protein A
VGWFATVILQLPPPVGFLLGAIVSSTDAAAIFSVLRSRKVSLAGKLSPLLELESGSNDPMAVFLTLGAIRYLTDRHVPFLSFLQSFAIEFVVGILIAFAASRAVVAVNNRIRLEYEGLYQVLLIALVLLTYSVSVFLKGNGFLSVYLAGVLIGNSNFLYKKAMKRSFEGFAWLMQIVMFLALGLLVFPSRLLPIAGAGMLISLFLMFFARPLSVFLCLLPWKMRLREKTMVAWVGLRGSVPIILATFPFLSHIAEADLIFNVVFFIVLTSVLFQGTSVAPVSRLLKVDAPLKNKPVYPIEIEYTGEINADLVDFIVPFDSPAAGKPIFELGIPPECLIVLISRNEKYFIPSGGTVLEAGDVLLALANKQDLNTLGGILGTRR